MNLPWYLHDGACHEVAVGVDIPVDAIFVDRPPVPGEWWDIKIGAWAMDAAVAANHNFPPAAIERADLIREIESSLILSGIALTHGLLAEESAATGVKLSDLAGIVADKTAGFREREVTRCKAKAGQ